ncbi:MAG: MBL fold metallo-hydrolase, partial [Caldiserica bacterium]
MELRKIKEGIFYISDTTNIGVLQAKKGFVLIDAPIDKDKAKKIIKILESNGIKPTDLILTHHHADHTGGAKYLKERFNLTVYTSAKERVFIENPILEPIYLSLGGEPFKLFLTKWIKSKEVKVDRVLEDGDFEIEGKKFRILSLPGHSIDMIGVEVDGVIFSADTFFSTKILKKYIVPYFHNPYRFVESIERLKSLP